MINYGWSMAEEHEKPLQGSAAQDVQQDHKSLPVPPRQHAGEKTRKGPGVKAMGR